MTPLTWNADREKLSAKKTLTQFSIGWKNYLNPGAGEPWRIITPEIQSDLSVTAFPGNVQFPVSSQGLTSMVFDSAFSMKRHIDERNGNNSEPEFTLELQVESQHNITGHIDESRPWQILYPNAWDSAHLRLGVWKGRGTRVEKVVEIHSEPAGSSEFIEYSFLLRSSTAKIWTGEMFDVRPWTGSVNETATIYNGEAFIARAESQIRGAILRNPVAWYYENGNKIITPISVRFNIIETDTVRAIKSIPRSLIQAALAAGSSLYTDATFSPDASPETSTVDGFTGVIDNWNSWTDTIALGATYASYNLTYADASVMATSTVGTWGNLFRSHFLFDTSTISANQSVDSSNLLVWGTQKYTDNLGLAAQVYSTNPYVNTQLRFSDHATVGSTPFSTEKPIFTMPIDQSVTWDLNSDGKAAIDVTGITKLAIALSHDRENGTFGDPTWISDKQSGWETNTSETSTDPLLTVSHSGPYVEDTGALEIVSSLNPLLVQLIRRR